MSQTDVITLLLVFAAMVIFLVAVVLRYSDCSIRIKMIGGRVLLASSFMYGISALAILFRHDLYNLPEHTANGLIAAVSLAAILIFNVLKMFPPISMRTSKPSQ